MLFDENEIRGLLGQALACKNEDEMRNEVCVDSPFERVYGIDESDLQFMQEKIAAKMNGQSKHVPIPVMSESPRQYANRLNRTLDSLNTIRDRANDQIAEGRSVLQKVEKLKSLRKDRNSAETEFDQCELEFFERREKKLTEIQQLSKEIQELELELQH